MTLQPFTKEQMNYFKFAHIVKNEFPKALRQSFKYLWDTTYGHRPGYRSWDDSKEVREMFLREEGGTTDVPTNLSYTEWDCSKLFQATIYSQSFSEEDSEGRKRSLSEKYVKPHRLAKGEPLTSIEKSSTSVTETFTIAIYQLRILRNNLFHLTKAEIDAKTFESYIQLSEKAFGFLNVATASIKAISSYSEDDFPTEKARKIGEDKTRHMKAELRYINEILENSLHGTMKRSEELLESIIETFGKREKVLQELIKSGVYPSDTGDFEPVSEKISVTENEKRWLITGIALKKILLQHIRPHVKQRMLQIYGQKSYVEDCKKIVRKKSGHYYGDIKSFDEFDLQAILKLLSDFGSPSHCPGAIGVTEVRNNWVHIDCNQWDKAKLDKSFRAMENLVKEMRLPGEDQRELLESLRYLEEKGERLFSNYGAKTSLENQVKQLLDEVNDKLEYVRAIFSIASVVRDEKKPDQQLIEGETKLTEDTPSELGEMLLSNYGAKTSLENQVKQLRDDVTDKLEYVRASLVSIASVVRDEKKPDQQLMEGETKLTEDTSSERLEKSLSRSKIGEVKDSTSLKKVTSVPKDKQQTEEQRGEDESESFEETLSENRATSPSTIDKGKDSISPEEVISVQVVKQQTEEQSGEDESEPFKETLSVGPETSLSHSKIGEVKDPTSLEEVTSVPNDKQQTEEQSFEETLGENQAISPSAIDKGKDPASLEEVISVPIDKQQTEEQSGEDESESFEITLSVGPATSPSTIDKGKDSTTLEEVISVTVDKQQTEGQSGEDESESFKETLSMGPETSLSRLKIGELKDPTSLEEVTSVPKDKQQTEEQSGEDESESFEETLDQNQATSPSTIDKGKDSTSLEEVVSVPMDKQQTEEQSEEDKTESFEIMLGVGPAAQDHDIKVKTTTFEAEHKECIRVLPYTNASGQVYVQLYVFCDKNSIPEELKEAAQEFFGETGVELKWTNLYNYASNIPNIVSKDFKQLEVSQANIISKIINKNLPVFSKHRNITAIQPSLKVTNSKQTNYPCIRVYVLGKGCIPVGESEIPNAVENFPVDIVDGFWLETLDIPKPLTAHRQEKCLRVGASIGVRGAKTAGTLGAIVKEGSKFYLLSCDHVINHEWEKEIIHPGGAHYLASLKYHLTEYQNWINRIIEPENRLKDSNLMPKSIFEHLKNQVNSFYNATDVQRDTKLEECERKLNELFSEKPRTVAYYKDGFRQNMKIPGGSECFIDVAIAELTDKEVEALKDKGYVEIIDTTNYPNGDVSRDASQNGRKEWCKSGSSTGYTTLENHYYLENVILKTAEHERPSFFPGNLELPETYVGNEQWRVNCLLFPHNQNVFSNLGDSGAVIFEISEGQPQALSGFGIVLGVIFSQAGCGTVAAPLFSALDLLYEKLGRRFTLVSKF